MPENTTPEIKPLLLANPGDPITAGRWNAMQCLLRGEHVQHAHTGAWQGDLHDGAPITAAGLADAAVTTPHIADRAVTGAKIDPATSITVQHLTVTGTLRAAALALDEAEALALPCRELKLGHSTRRGAAAGRALTDLKQGGHDQLGINDGADWTEGVKIGSDLQVTGKATVHDDLTAAAATTLSGALTVRSSAAIAGAVTVGTGLSVTGTWTATSGAAISGALTTTALTVRGAPLGTTRLELTGKINATAGLAVAGPLLANDGLTVAGPLTIQDGLTVQGAPLNTTSGLTVTSAPLTLNNSLTVAGSAALQNLHVTGNVAMQSVLAMLGNPTMKGRNVVSVESSGVPRVLYGFIRDDGGAITNNTWSTDKYFYAQILGSYFKLVFIKPFAAAPTLLIGQIGDSPLDNPVISSVTEKSAIVYTSNRNIAVERRSFTFIAIGYDAA